MKILVTGCARSGTMYIAKVLQEIDLDVQHEKIGEDGTSDWHKVWDDLTEFDVVLHQVRHPLKVISSMTTAPMSTWESINKYVPLTLKNNLIDGMRFWYFWNLMVEPYHSIRYRIEDIKSVWPSILATIETPYVDLPNISNKINSRGHKMCTWFDLELVDRNLYLQIKRLSKQYGYV